MAAERSAAAGDLVTVRLTSDNETVAASVASEEPLMFQLGSEGIMGNELFQVPCCRLLMMGMELQLKMIIARQLSCPLMLNRW